MPLVVIADIATHFECARMRKCRAQAEMHICSLRACFFPKPSFLHSLSLVSDKEVEHSAPIKRFILQEVEHSLCIKGYWEIERLS